MRKEFRTENSKKKSLVLRVLLLFTLFNLISVLLFGFSMFSVDKYNREKQLEATINYIMAERSQLISLSIRQIEYMVENLADYTEDYYVNSTENHELSDEYYLNADGVLLRRADKKLDENGLLYDRSSVFFPNTQEFDDAVKNFTMESEKLDETFIKIHNSISYLSCIAIPMTNGFLRTYPYMEMDMYSPDHMQSGDPFFTAATKENPNRKTIWTELYMDLLGGGWVITCTHPIMDENDVAGVACLDVNLETLKNDLLADFRLGESGFAFMITDNGQIIYHPKAVPFSGERGDVFQMNIINDTDFSDDYKNALTRVINEDEGLIRYSEGDDIHIISFSSIESVPWKLGIEVSQDEFISTGKIEGKNIITMVAFAVLLLCFFAIYLYRNYSQPLRELVERAKRISQGDYSIDPSNNSYVEVEELSNAFNNMSESIEENTSNLMEKNLEIETILDGVSGLLMTVNSNCEIVRINSNGLNDFNLREGNVSGRKCYEVLMHQSQICAGCPVLETLNDKVPRNALITIGNRIQEISCRPIEIGDNDAEAIVFSQNVTDRVILERELLQKEKLANIGQLSSSIAHELKVPLSVIKGASYLIQSYNVGGIEDERIKHQSEIIDETVRDAEGIIYNLLDYSRMSDGSSETVDIEKLINQVIMISRQDVNRIDISISTSFSGHPFKIQCNKESLKQILVNLISNAFFALEKGGRLDIIGEHFIENDMNFMRLVIRDNGSGIDEETQKLLFKPFVASTKGRKGLGLGLWISRRLSEKMGGNIEIQSEKGKGTEAILILPTEPTK